MPEVHFHHKGKEASRTIRVTGIEQLRQVVLAMRQEMKMPFECRGCGKEIRAIDNHVCPNIVDAEFADDFPLLPEKTDG
jgi:hypothetical protein